MNYHLRTRHKILSEVWKVVENNGFFGDLDDNNDEFIQFGINELNSIKHSLQATLIETPVKQLTFDSNLRVETCMHMSYTNKQVAILRDYLDHPSKATKCQVLAQKLTKPNLNLADIFELLLSSIWMTFLLHINHV